MSNELYAGLTPIEANEALCEWLNSQQDAEAPYFIVTLFPAKGQFCAFLRFDNGDEEIDTGLFSSDHNAIHRVLDAMSDQELAKANGELLLMFGWADINTPSVQLQIALLRATPAQKCVAALRALGLGREA